MLSNQQIRNNWPAIKSLILSKWSRLTEEEVEKTHGNINALQRIVDSKYGNKANFEEDLEKVCWKFSKIKVGKTHNEMDVAEKSMDKDRDDQYLTDEYGVTIPIHDRNVIERKTSDKAHDESYVDGFNNVDRHSADYSGLNMNLNTKKTTNTASDEIQTNQVPGPKDEDITKRRSNSSANTTSHSAHTSSDAMS